jgi:hypothetical protein
MNQFILTEGLGDKDFIIGLLKKIGKAHVDCFPPKDIGGPSNGIDNVVKVIPLVINKIVAGEASSVAILIDADYTGIENGGFTSRRKQVTDILANNGYVIPPLTPTTISAGEVFNHPKYSAPIGLFIMPNHKDDGMLEDLLKQLVTQSPHVEILSHAITAVKTLPSTLFNQILHTSKAEVNAFLSWQRKPPARSSACIEHSIFDASSPAISGLIGWVNSIFP